MGAPVVHWRHSVSWASEICIASKAASQTFCIANTNVLLRHKKKISIKYYTTEIKIICIQMKKKYYSNIIFHLAFLCFETKKKDLLSVTFSLLLRSEIFLVENYF